MTNTILEQTFEIEYLVQHGQCSDCARLSAKNTWKALVQVRQKVPHKRTFLFLEQLILKHGAQKDTISVKEVRDGLDFFYSQKSHAVKMVEFLAGVVPVRYVAGWFSWYMLTTATFSAQKRQNKYCQRIPIPIPQTSNTPTRSKSLPSAKKTLYAFHQNKHGHTATSRL